LEKIYIQTIKWDQFTLGVYDADNETYLLDHPELGKIAIPVPFSFAQNFKENFNNMDYSGYDFVFANNKINLSMLKISDKKTGKSFTYDNKQSITYTAQQIDYNFSDIVVDVPKSSSTFKSNISLQEQNMKVGNDPVDTDIPSGNAKRVNTFALIIGNERYSNERSVPYAMNDAITFNKYLSKTMGLPEENIHLVTNATLGQMLGEIKWITNVAKAYQGNASIIFYYAGHGMPDESSKDAYLLPVDGNSTMVQTAIKLEWLYSELNDSPTKQVAVLMDACFSGGARDGMLADGRGVKIKPKDDVLIGNFVVISAATGDQTAYPYEDKQHGLFTYFLLLKLQETKGNVSMGELSEFLKTNVSRVSVVKNNKPQDPKVNVSFQIQDKWQNFKLAQ
jgi:hypothetical protein